MHSKETLKHIFEESLSLANHERTGMTIKGTKGTGKGQALAGITGAPAGNFHGTMDISDTTAADESIAAAGVIQDYTFRLA